MFSENEHNQNYLNSIGKESKHPATKMENTDEQNIVTLPSISIMALKIKELQKTRCQVIKKRIYSTTTKVNYCQTVTPAFRN